MKAKEGQLNVGKSFVLSVKLSAEKCDELGLQGGGMMGWSQRTLWPTASLPK